MKLLHVEIPRELKHLNLDSRGFPIPYTTKIDETGCPHFSITNAGRMLECLTKLKCHICGNDLLDDLWMIGGPSSAFDERGSYGDGPVHKACGEFALKVCPFLSNISYNVNPEALERKVKESDFGNVFIDLSKPSKNVPFQVFSLTEDYRFHVGHQTIIIPVKPFLLIEYWKDGMRISGEEAEDLLIKAGLPNYIQENILKG